MRQGNIFTDAHFLSLVTKSFCAAKRRVGCQANSNYLPGGSVVKALVRDTEGCGIQSHAKQVVRKGREDFYLFYVKIRFFLCSQLVSAATILQLMLISHHLFFSTQ